MRAIAVGALALGIVAGVALALVTFSMGQHTLWYWLCTPWWLS